MLVKPPFAAELSEPPVEEVIKNQISLADSPLNIAFNPSNGYMYVTHPTSNTVSVIDPSINQVNSTISLNQDHPNDIAFNPSNGYMYVTNQDSNTVSVINSTNKVIHNITVGNFPDEIVFNPIDNNMYLLSQNTAYLYVIDSLTNTVVKIIPVNFLQNSVNDIVFNPTKNNMYISMDSTTIVVAQFTPSLLDAVCPLENAQHWNSITFKITSPELAEIVNQQKSFLLLQEHYQFQKM